MRRPLAEVLAWPASHVALLLAFVSREPPAEARTEMAVAKLTAEHYNRTRAPDDKPVSTADCLLFADPWGTGSSSPDASDLDARLNARLNQLGE